MAPVRRIWITRAEPGASRTAGRLAALGFEPLVAALLAIRALPQTPDLADVAALAFTSANAVAAFAALTPSRAHPVFAVGDATTRAARAAGYGEVLSAAGDLDALAALIGARWRDPAAVILHPSALRPAGDLAAGLAGIATVRTLPVYEAVETDALAPEAFDAVLIHSTRAGRALAARLAPGRAAGRVAAAISPAAAGPFAALPFAEVRVAPTPDEAALLATLGKSGPRV